MYTCVAIAKIALPDNYFSLRRFPDQSRFPSCTRYRTTSCHAWDHRSKNDHFSSNLSPLLNSIKTCLCSETVHRYLLDDHNTIFTERLLDYSYRLLDTRISSCSHVNDYTWPRILSRIGAVSRNPRWSIESIYTRKSSRRDTYTRAPRSHRKIAARIVVTGTRWRQRRSGWSTTRDILVPVVEVSACSLHVRQHCRILSVAIPVFFL